MVIPYEYERRLNIRNKFALVAKACNEFPPVVKKKLQPLETPIISPGVTFTFKKEVELDDGYKPERYRVSKTSPRSTPEKHPKAIKRLRKNRKEKFEPLKDHIDHSLTP